MKRRDQEIEEVYLPSEIMSIETIIGSYCGLQNLDPSGNFFKNNLECYCFVVRSQDIINSLSYQIKRFDFKMYKR